MLYREDGEIIPVAKNSLPVVLPDIEKFQGVGNPLDKSIDIGAIIAPVQLKKIKSLVKQGRKLR